MAHLTSTRKIYEQQGIDAAVETYLAAMGVGDPVMTLMRKTPAASIRWLSLADLKASRLATLALDPDRPDPRQRLERPQRPRVRRRSARRRSRAGEHRRVSRGARPGARNRLPLSARRRDGGSRSGGARLDGDADAPSPHWSVTLSAAGVEPLQLKTDGATPARVLVPRERFCALIRGGAIVAATDDLPELKALARALRAGRREDVHRASLSLSNRRQPARPPPQAPRDAASMLLPSGSMTKAA